MIKFILIVLLLCVSCKPPKSHEQIHYMKNVFVAKMQLENVICDFNGIYICFAQTKGGTQVKFICNPDADYTKCSFIYN